MARVATPVMDAYQFGQKMEVPDKKWGAAVEDRSEKFKGRQEIFAGKKEEVEDEEENLESEEKVCEELPQPVFTEE